MKKTGGIKNQKKTDLLANLNIHCQNNYLDYLELQSLMQFNNSLFSCTQLLLCRFVQPSLVLAFKRGEIPHDQIKGEVLRDGNISDKTLCQSVGFLVFFDWFLVRSFHCQKMGQSVTGKLKIFAKHAQCFTCKPFFMLYVNDATNISHLKKIIPSRSKKLKNTLQNLTKKRLMKHLNC